MSKDKTRSMSKRFSSLAWGARATLEMRLICQQLNYFKVQMHWDISEASNFLINIRNPTNISEQDPIPSHDFSNPRSISAWKQAQSWILVFRTDYSHLGPEETSRRNVRIRST